MQLIFNIIFSFVVYLLFAKSFEIIYRTAGFFHMAHAASLTLGAYMAYTASIVWSMSFWLSMILSIALVELLMLLINRYIYMPGIKLNLKGWQLMIVSLGIYVVFQNLISMIWGDSTLSFRTWEIKAGHEFMGAYVTDVQIGTILLSAVLLVGYWLFVERTKTGQKIKAVSSNATLCTILGISRSKVNAWSIAIGTGLASCAGILIAADSNMTPTMGFSWLLFAIVAMIIGGTGKMRHLLFGALLLATAQHLTAYYLDSKWMEATAYIILILFLYFRPYGFSGKSLKKSSI